MCSILRGTYIYIIIIVNYCIATFYSNSVELIYVPSVATAWIGSAETIENIKKFKYYDMFNSIVNHIIYEFYTNL